MLPKRLVLALLLSSVALIALLLFPLYRKKTLPSTELAATKSAELNVNIHTVSFECSHHGKKWHICYDDPGDDFFIPDAAALYCPAYSELNATELEHHADYQFFWDTCFPCPDANSNCALIVEQVVATVVNNDMYNDDYPFDATKATNDLNSYCELMCEAKQEGESCDENDKCAPGQHFCDYASDDMYRNSDTGTCKLCPANIEECSNDGFTTSTQGQLNCKNCRLVCWEISASKLWVGGELISSKPIGDSVQSSYQNASGALHDCSVLELDAKTICPGAEGKMCIVSVTNYTEWSPWKVSNQAEKSGCVGVIASHPSNVLTRHQFTELLIPFVSISEEDGLKLLSEKIETLTKLEVDVFGGACDPNWNAFYSINGACSASDRCPDGEYCAFYTNPIDENVYGIGTCLPCPNDSDEEPDPLACYFDQTALTMISIWDNSTFTFTQTASTGENTEEDSYPDTVQNVVSCAESCKAEAALISKSCKFCSEELTKFEFAESSSEEGTSCVFCPQYDVLYPDRIVALFGDTVTCSDMETFFRRMPVPQDSSNCQLAQSMNYICGCEGKGYGGANTHAKKSALAWMPRVSAVLSLLVSR